jgi:hypothetical protein
MDVHGFYSTAYLSDIWGKTRRVARQFVLLNDELRIGAILAKPNTPKNKSCATCVAQQPTSSLPNIP